MVVSRGVAGGLHQCNAMHGGSRNCAFAIRGERGASRIVHVRVERSFRREPQHVNLERTVVDVVRARALQHSTAVGGEELEHCVFVRDERVLLTRVRPQQQRTALFRFHHPWLRRYACAETRETRFFRS